MMNLYLCYPPVFVPYLDALVQQIQAAGHTAHYTTSFIGDAAWQQDVTAALQASDGVLILKIENMPVAGAYEQQLALIREAGKPALTLDVTAYMLSRISQQPDGETALRQQLQGLFDQLANAALFIPRMTPQDGKPAPVSQGAPSGQPSQPEQPQTQHQNSEPPPQFLAGEDGEEAEKKEAVDEFGVDVDELDDGEFDFDDEADLDDLRGGAAQPEEIEVYVPIFIPATKPIERQAPPEPEPEPQLEQTEAPAALPRDKVQFSAYYPPAAQPEKRYGLFVYAHTAELLAKTQQDVARFEDELGGVVPAPKTGKQAADIERGTPIRIVPECDEVEFDPPYLEKKWRGDWTRYEFEFTPTAASLGESLWVRVSVQIAGIEVAHIKCDIEVTEAAANTADRAGTEISTRMPTGMMLGDATPDNPLAAAKLKSSTVRLYQRIFISYSRQDTEVAAAYRKAQMAAGHEVFLDTENIRAGEDWQAALARAIDNADIFQLFWSEHSASSPNVRDEWEYCLNHKCTDDECRGFIRPVYWQKPMPKPPSELGHLNFRYVALQGDDDEAEG